MGVRDEGQVPAALPSGKQPPQFYMGLWSGFEGCQENKISCLHGSSNPDLPRRREPLYPTRDPGPC